MQISGTFQTDNGAANFLVNGYDEKDCAERLSRFIGGTKTGAKRSAEFVSDLATELRSIPLFWRAYDELSAPRPVSHPTANLLRTVLACHERPGDMRLNPHLDESDIAETVRIAIECIETEGS